MLNLYSDYNVSRYNVIHFHTKKYFKKIEFIEFECYIEF